MLVDEPALMIGSCHNLARRTEQSDNRRPECIRDVHRSTVIGRVESRKTDQARQFAPRSSPCEVDDAVRQIAADLTAQGSGRQVAEINDVEIGIVQKTVGHFAESLGKPAFGRAVRRSWIDADDIDLVGHAALAEQSARIFFLLSETYSTGAVSDTGMPSGARSIL